MTSKNMPTLFLTDGVTRAAPRMVRAPKNVRNFQNGLNCPG